MVFHPLLFLEVVMAKATKERKTTKVSKAEKQAKDETEKLQPVSENEPGRSGERSYGQDDEDTNNQVMGERQEASRADAETDEERIARRTNSSDSGEDDYAADGADGDDSDEDQDFLQKDQDTYADEDQAEGEDYDEDEAEDRRGDR
jgi:hypothetical protein